MTARRLAWACTAAVLLAACQSKAARLQERQLSTQARDVAGADAAPADTNADITRSANVPIATNKPVVVHFTLTDSGFVGPDSILGGAIDMRVTNRGKFTHELRLMIAPRGATAAFMAWAHGDTSIRRPPQLDPMGGVGPLPPGGSSQFILTERTGEYIMIDMMPAGDGKRWWQRGNVRPLRIVGNAPLVMQPPVMRTNSAILASDAAWRFGFAVNTNGTRSKLVEGRNRPTDIDAGRQLVVFEFLGGQRHDAVIYKAEDPFVMREYAAWLDQRRREPPPGLVTGIPALYGRMKVYMWLPLEHGAYIVFCPTDHDTPTKRGHGFEFGEFSQFVAK